MQTIQSIRTRNDIEKEKMLKALLEMRGIMKGKVKPMTVEEDKRLRREAGKEFFEKMEKEINRK